ncbi:MAG: hypothetical protein IT564_05025 [Rhodospirillales bacterium]|nr:hypothetical protein [Rhodospirillales bacterium]
MQTWRYGVAAVLAAGVGLAAFAAAAAMTADQIRQQIERESGGQVIKIESRKYGTLEAFAVTVMNPGGNDNGAFQIYTVIVNAENGTTVPEQRQTQHY